MSAAHSHAGHSHSPDHGHGRGHGGHSHGPKATGLILAGSLVLTIVFVAIEAVAGYWSGSLALISDAGHNFQDAFGLVLAAIAFRFEAKPGNEFKTYGYQRSGVVAAFVNALLLVALSVFILFESYQRLLNPEPIEGMTMLIVAAIGLVVNLVIAWGLGGHGHDLNIRAAFLHQIGDAASCVGIIVGAIVIRYTGWLAVDPILSILISLIIIWTAWDIFRDSLNILLEGMPKGIDLGQVDVAIRGVTGVEGVHDLHIWSLGSQAHALSCHLVIADVPLSESSSILDRVNSMLRQSFAIDHTTIQFEANQCSLPGECALATGRLADRDHAHTPAT